MLTLSCSRVVRRVRTVLYHNILHNLYYCGLWAGIELALPCSTSSFDSEYYRH
jgi:hypothetical protein